MIHTLIQEISCYYNVPVCFLFLEEVSMRCMPPRVENGTSDWRLFFKASNSIPVPVKVTGVLGYFAQIFKSCRKRIYASYS